MGMILISYYEKKRLSYKNAGISTKNIKTHCNVIAKIYKPLFKNKPKILIFLKNTFLN